jgi:hypothetical protein
MEKKKRKKTKQEMKIYQITLNSFSTFLILTENSMILKL